MSIIFSSKEKETKKTSKSKYYVLFLLSLLSLLLHGQKLLQFKYCNERGNFINAGSFNYLIFIKITGQRFYSETKHHIYSRISQPFQTQKLFKKTDLNLYTSNEYRVQNFHQISITIIAIFSKKRAIV